MASAEINENEMKCRESRPVEARAFSNPPCLKPSRQSAVTAVRFHNGIALCKTASGETRLETKGVSLCRYGGKPPETYMSMLDGKMFTG